MSVRDLTPDEFEARQPHVETTCNPRAWARATAPRRPVLPVVLPGKLFGAYRSGAATVRGPACGRTPFEELLAGRTGAPR